MKDINPQSDDEALRACIADIYSAFKDVSRENGISWNECVALDRCESEDKIAKARRSDKDSHWEQLVDDAAWEPFSGIGGFPFIDTIGFRYYLPATMVRFLRGERSDWYPGHLLSSIDRHVVKGDASWTTAQLEAIARFILFMAARDPDEESRRVWETALKSRWISHIPAFESK